MPPLVSVIVPCYRQAHFLAQAVESVTRQTYPTYEIIVIDDGSPDGVAEVVQRYPVRYIRQENRGLSAARNRGLEMSQGEYLVFLDADDRLLPNALHEGVTALSCRPDCAFVWGFNHLIGADGRLLPSKTSGFAGGASFGQLLRGNIVGPPAGVMFRRSMLVAAGGFSGELEASEDYELYLRLARNYPSWCHGKLVAEYRLHEANMSSDYALMFRSVLRVLDLQRPWVGTNPEYRRALARGRRDAHRHYDAEPRLLRLGAAVRARRWVQATGEAAALLVRYPALLARALVRYARRALAPARTTG